MSSPCRSCGEREAEIRRVCRRCYNAIVRGALPDVRSPSGRWGAPLGVRHPDAVARRIAGTLARYPHLRRTE